MVKFETAAQAALGAVKVTLFFAALVTLIPITAGYRALRPEDSFRLPPYFHRFLLWLFGFKVRVHGAPAQSKPVLFVSNHLSYLDVPVLGAQLPAAFVAKSEVAHWPLFGYLAKLQNTVFIERRAARAGAQRGTLQERLDKKQNMILFPEGTSSDGTTVLPFKSSLFSIVEGKNASYVTVQPVSLSCVLLDGKPLTKEGRDGYAWYGDMTMPPHLWGVFKRGHYTIDVTFHPPLSPAAFADRKQLAAACQQQIARGLVANAAPLSLQSPL